MSQRCRQQSADEQSADAERPGKIASPVARSSAMKSGDHHKIQQCGQMGRCRDQRVPVENLEDLRERRKQQVQVSLRCNGRKRPTKSDCPRHKHEADSQLGCVDAIGNNVSRRLAERQGERQRARIEPRKVRQVHRSHPSKRVVGAEIEKLAEVENSLGVPFCPLAVDRRVQQERCTLHADDHQDREDSPGRKVGHRRRLHGGWADDSLVRSNLEVGLREMAAQD
jgi:hypothetical protein